VTNVDDDDVNYVCSDPYGCFQWFIDVVFYRYVAKGFPDRF